MTTELKPLRDPPRGYVWSSGHNPVDVGKTSGSLTQIRVQGIQATYNWASEMVANLQSWAIEHNCEIIPDTSISGQRLYRDSAELIIPRKWKVTRVKGKPVDYFSATSLCWNCHREVVASESRCNNCGIGIRCGSCSLSFTKLFKTGEGRGNWSCAACSKKCAECDRRFLARVDVRNAKFAPTKCQEHEPRFVCRNCRYSFPNTYGKETPYGMGCEDCVKKYTCKDCNTYNPHRRMSAGLSCADCKDKELENKRIKQEKWDQDEIPRDGTMLIPSSPERPVRTISIETELDGDGQYLARTLFRKGLVPLDTVGRYGYHPDDDTYPAFVKHDGTVTAGELVSFRINMDEPTHVAALTEVLLTARSLERIGKVKRNATAGGHIHIDAHNFSYADCWRLTMLWNYLEDVIYRLAGATCSYGHRTLHSDASRHHISQVIKGPFGTKGTFGSRASAQGRAGLNLTFVISAMAHCKCGASAYEDSKRCKCHLVKNTIEWRVWNSCLNPRVLHAWIAFMQAMHAFADGGEGGVDLNAEEEARFPSLDWNYRKLKACIDDHRTLVKSRLEWIFRYLPLTGGEKDSLVYACKQSELKLLGDHFLNSLLNIEPVNPLPDKKFIVRNPSRRERELRIKPPDPGASNPQGSMFDSVPMEEPPLYRSEEPGQQRTPRAVPITSTGVRSANDRLWSSSTGASSDGTFVAPHEELLRNFREAARQFDAANHPTVNITDDGTDEDF